LPQGNAYKTRPNYTDPSQQHMVHNMLQLPPPVQMQHLTYEQVVAHNQQLTDWNGNSTASKKQFNS